MAYNQNFEVRTSFKKYMHIQVRYIKFLSHVLEIDTMQTVERYALRYKELYTKKHQVYINS